MAGPAVTGRPQQPSRKLAILQHLGVVSIEEHLSDIRSEREDLNGRLDESPPHEEVPVILEVKEKPRAHEIADDVHAARVPLLVRSFPDELEEWEEALHFPPVCLAGVVIHADPPVDEVKIEAGVDERRHGFHEEVEPLACRDRHGHLRAPGPLASRDALHRSRVVPQQRVLDKRYGEIAIPLDSPSLLLGNAGTLEQLAVDTEGLRGALDEEGGYRLLLEGAVIVNVGPDEQRVGSRPRHAARPACMLVGLREVASAAFPDGRAYQGL